MAQICIKIDDDIKKNAERVCDNIGISLSTAIKIYLKKLGNEFGIPFDVTADPFYNPNNINYLDYKLDAYRKGNLKFAHHDLIEDKDE